MVLVGGLGLLFCKHCLVDLKEIFIFGQEVKGERDRQHRLDSYLNLPHEASVCL